ncbi:MAG: hypothetical protein KJ062_13185 [Thermoanaerobaculia bacterium]|nr:hypothetical protein [Thermoanaerobaculia bacterium]
MKRFPAPFVLAALLLATPSFATTVDPETEARVPALSAFHAVVYPLWHEAWPNKDVEALVALAPKVEAGVEAIAKAELPGILRDKKATWEAAVARLRTVAGEYAAAASKKDGPALLDAAEDLHSQFERMVRIVRPVLKEIEAFHATLYVLYHRQLDPFALDAVSQSVRTMKGQVGPLSAASLPERLKAKAGDFEAARARLATAVDAAVASLDGKDEKAIRAAIELLHTRYQEVEAVFD